MPIDAARRYCNRCGLVVDAPATSCPRCATALTAADPSGVVTAAHHDRTVRMPNRPSSGERGAATRAAITPPVDHDTDRYTPRPGEPRRASGELSVPHIAAAGATDLGETVSSADAEARWDPFESGDREHPTRLGRYEIRGVIGRGGMGIVYEGWDAGLERRVAIKMLAQAGLADEDDLQRFVREARVAAKLQHPGIVMVHEVGAHDGHPYIVMDHVEGESFEERLRRERVPPRRIAAVIRDVAHALEHAHERGVIHRDVKPHNVLIDLEGRTRLTDFGLAQDAATMRQITLTGQVMGTPSYMAPEQAAGDNHGQGPHTDVWMLGAVLYRALVGRPPYEGKTPLAIIQKVLSEEPRAPRQARPTIHSDLETITLRCLTKDPAGRYRSAREVGDDLDRFLEGETIRARALGRIERVGRWTRRRRVPVTVVAIGGVAALVALAIVVRGAVSSATRRERQELAAAASSAADDAFNELQGRRRAIAAAEERAPLPRDDRRRRHERLLGLALDVVQTAQHAASLADGDARARTRSAWVILAEVAIGAEQWSLAESAIARARSIDADSPHLARLARHLDEARSARARERQLVVEDVLTRARRGELRGDVDRERALFALVGAGDEATVARLASELTATAATLRDATEAFYRAAAAPNAAEARAGEEPVTGADAAIAWLLGRGEVDAATPSGEVAGAVAAIERRVLARAAREVAPPGTVPRSLDEVVRARQRAALAETASLARVCCEALGHIGSASPEAIDALAAYLAIEADDRRAARAAIALCILGGGRAEHIVTTARGRFGAESRFWTEVAPFLGETGVTTADTAGEPGDDPGALLERAVTLAAKGAPEEALASLDRALELDPRHVAALLRRAAIRSERGELTASRADLDRAVAAGSADAATWTARGRLRREMGDHAGAIADLGEAIERAPDDPTPWQERAIAHRLIGDGRRAIEDADRAVTMAPRSASALVTRARVRRRAGLAQGALEDANAAAELDPELAEAWALRAEARLDLGDLAGARGDATRAIELDPDDAIAWGVRADARRRAGDLAGAVADYDRAVALRPDHPGFVNDRAIVRRDQGDTAGAERDFTRAIELDPSQPGVWANRGLVRLMRRDLARAEEDLSRAISMQPVDPILFTQRAVIRRAARDLAGALADLDQAAGIAPENAMVLRNRGQVRADLGKLDDGILDLERSVQLDPKNVPGWALLGMARASAGRKAAAIEAYDRAIALDPTHAQSWVERASTRASAGDLAGAIEDASRAIAIVPRLPRAWLVRGMARADSGEPGAARADLERFLELVPDDPLARIARGRLEDLR